MFKTIKVIIASFCLSACVSQPINIDTAALPETDEKTLSILEKRLGDEGFHYMQHDYKFVDDPKTINRLNAIGARIAAYTERPHIHYRYFIVDTADHNVYSLPNGYIIFHKGFVQDVDQEDILAAVIAHEIAHVTHKHGVAKDQRRTGKSLSSIIGEMVFNMATEIHIRQTLELQADQTSIRYLYQAGYDPNAAVRLMEKLKSFREEYIIKLAKELDKDPEGIARQMDKFVSTHPDPEDRISNARRYIQEVIKTEEVQYSPEEFQF